MSATEEQRATAGPSDAPRPPALAGALDAAQAHRFDDPATDADRRDLEADALWWLGRLEECIAAREEAYRIYDELGDRRRAGQCAVWLWEHHAICARPAIASGWLATPRIQVGRFCTVKAANTSSR